AVVTDRVLPGNCFAPFHWNDLFGEYVSVNAVTNDAVDPLSFQPELKVCAVALTPATAPGLMQAGAAGLTQDRAAGLAEAGSAGTQAGAAGLTQAGAAGLMQAG